MPDSVDFCIYLCAKNTSIHDSIVRKTMTIKQNLLKNTLLKLSLLDTERLSNIVRVFTTLEEGQECYDSMLLLSLKI